MIDKIFMLDPWKYPPHGEPPDGKIIHVIEYDASREKAIEGMREALKKSVQLCEIANDWQLDEVEIDNSMMLTRLLKEEFQSALAAFEKVR